MHPMLSLQKVTTAGVLVFFEPSFTQALAGLCISMVWLGGLTMTSPFPTTGENACEFVINMSVGFIMVGAVSTKVLALQDEVPGQLVERMFISAILWLSAIAGIGAIVVAMSNEYLHGGLREAVQKQMEPETQAEVPEEPAASGIKTDIEEVSAAQAYDELKRRP